MIQALALIILAITVIVIAIFTLNKYKKISATGVESEGIVFEIESSTTSINTTTLTYPIVRFLTRKNEWITQKASVSIVPSTYKKGQKIKVVYLEDKPTEFFIKSPLTNTIFALMIFIGLLLLTFATYSLINI